MIGIGWQDEAGGGGCLRDTPWLGFEILWAILFSRVRLRGYFIALTTMFVTFVACYDVNDGCKFNIDDRLVSVCGGRDKR